jgi:hypothetical protein
MNDIMGLIAKYSDDSTLANMRLCSRSLYELAEMPYIFAHVRHMKDMILHQAAFKLSLMELDWARKDYAAREPHINVQLGDNSQCNRMDAAHKWCRKGECAASRIIIWFNLDARCSASKYKSPNEHLLKKGRPSCPNDRVQKITVCTISSAAGLRTTVLHEVLIDSRWLDRTDN